MGEGERLHAERRKRFWTLLGGLLVAGFITGAVSGAFFGHVEHGGTPLPPWAAALGVAGVLLMVVAVAYGSWRFFVSVDEVEVADNLWGSLIGFYTYAILFPAWWALNRLRQVPEPDHWAIFAISMAAALAVYAYRKWQSR